MKPIIAVDLDDVLGDENHAMMHFINRRYGRAHTPEDYNITGEYWGFWQTVWGVDEAEAVTMYEAFLQAHDTSEVVQEIIPGAVEAINHLKKTYDLVIITSRQIEILRSTEKWLDSHFPATFKDVHFTALRGDRKKISKAQICQEIGASYLIDDNADHCSLAQEAGVQTLLFGDYGWNRTARVAPGVVRVRDWRAVQRYFASKQG